MHHFDSASKMADAIDNLEKVIRYTLGREYDVVLLSDHGFVDIEKKIDVQDKYKQIYINNVVKNENTVI